MDITGNNHYIEIEYKQPDWSEDLEECFKYKGYTYFLSDFMCIPPGAPFDLKYDGYHSDSFFSGILVKYSPCGDAVQAYTYIS